MKGKDFRFILVVNYRSESLRKLTSPHQWALPNFCLTRTFHAGTKASQVARQSIVQISTISDDVLWTNGSLV